MSTKWLPLFLGAAALAGVAIGWLSGRHSVIRSLNLDQLTALQEKFNAAGRAGKIGTILDIVDANYVDQVGTDSLEEAVIPELFKKLDPHSVYIPAEDAEDAAAELKSNFGGIGVTFSIINDTVNVISVVTGGPSAALGVMPGDKIIMVDDSLFVGKGLNNKKVMDTLRGEMGTNVKVTVLRHGSTTIDFDIVRGLIPMNSMQVAYKIADSVGYIKIDRFAEKTYEEMQMGIAKLKSQGCTKLIMDLRGNGGGFLNVVYAMCNEFLQKGDLIVYTEGRRQRRQDYVANGMGLSRDMEVCVLIDEFSASASEIFSGAIQDNDRGTIIGRRSFGKGLVQTEFPLADGSNFRLTISRYYTPSGRCIQRPYNHGKEEYYQDVNERYDNGELFDAGKIHADSSQIFHTRNGRTVYGGGGITPDIFVPYDSAKASVYLYELRAKRVIYEFAIAYAEQHRAQLKEMPAEKLVKRLQQQNFFEDLTAFALRRNVRRNKPLDAKERQIIENETRAYVGQLIKDDEAFYPILNTMDPAVDAALKQFGAKSIY